MQGKIEKTDVLVIGKGLAGIRAANAAARAGASVVLISKGGGSSPGIMGFNAAFGAEDSVAAFNRDTITSGSFINNKKVAARLSAEANKEAAFLEELGLVFDKNADGGYNLMQTVGSSLPRMIHYKSLTGQVAIKLILEDCRRLGVKFAEPVRALNLLKDDVDGSVIGASTFDMAKGEPVFFLAGAVVMAAGGNGAMYGLTSYPRGINGDGLAMAYRAGAALVDMEFQQFDPCGFVYPAALHGHVVVTTMLNEGGKMFNALGEEFMLKDGGRYNVQKCELSRRMWMEVLEGRGTEHGGVLYDLTALPRDRVVIDHCLFYDPALAAGVDLTKEPAEVAPVPHSLMGGLVIDDNCASTLPGLFAAGEIAGGIHGANRIGGNAGTEVFVYGAIAGTSAARYALAGEKKPDGCPAIDRENADIRSYLSLKGSKDVAALLKTAQEAVFRGLGIVRDAAGLKECLAAVDQLSRELDDVEVSNQARFMDFFTLKNNLIVSRIQIMASLPRQESRGVFYRRDFPEQDDAAWLKNTFIRRGENAEMLVTHKPVE
jgi:succinate dehydrogenase/fumarate reductase flavoprotein subunit